MKLNPADCSFGSSAHRPWLAAGALLACLCPALAPALHGAAPPYEDALGPGDSPESVPATLEADKPKDGTFDARWFEQPLDWASRQTDALEDKTGLRFGVAYTMVFQQATEGDGDLYGGSGDLDLMASWTFLGRGSENTGRLVAGTEYRHRIGSQPASALFRETGALLSHTGGFNDRYWAVRDVYWAQRLFDGQLRFLIGRGAASEFPGSQSPRGINAFFSNRHFSANNTAPYPDFTMMTGVSVRPRGDLFYATVGAANAYGNATHNNLDTLEEGEFFGELEVGITPEIPGLGRSRFALAPWYMPARTLDGTPEDWGLAFIAEQRFGDHLRAFARYGWADEALTNIRHSFQVGGGWDRPFGTRNDLLGVAFGWADGKAETSRDEKVVEFFYRWQVTRHSQLTGGFQAVFDPGNSSTRDSLGVVTGRWRVAF
ncbi:MAG TPA: carbohydrate porin [Verrucomicrobiota bacterium]|nr:carbohydrate porin [Verrucomicrobiota bacterium]